MTLDQIAEAMGTTQAELQLCGPAVPLHEFSRRAFADGHETWNIAKYTNRRDATILHALRWECNTRYGHPYSLSRYQLSEVLQ